LRGIWRGFGRRLATLLAPVCLACGEPCDGDELCADCEAGLPRNACGCPRCALPLAVPAPACGRCLRRPPPFSAALSPYLYADPVDRWLGALKFRDGLAAGRLLAERLADDVPTGFLYGIELAVPIPLHRRRLRERGYNQALELLRPLARQHRLPLPLPALQRRRDTPHQIGLDAKTRRRNLRGAFVADPAAVGGRRVLLFDDVITTGSTLREAAGELLRAGATEVRVLAVARAAGRSRTM